MSKGETEPESTQDGRENKADQSNAKVDELNAKKDQSNGEKDEFNGKEGQSNAKKDQSTGKEDESNGKEDESNGKEGQYTAKKDEYTAKKDSVRKDESETSEKRFLEFDWDKHDEWQKYLNSLYPTPTDLKLLKWQKKWYKNNIDDSFDMSTKAGEDRYPQPTVAAEARKRPPPPPPAVPTSQSTARPAAAGRSTGISGSHIMWMSISCFMLSCAIGLHLSSFVPSSMSGRCRMAAIFCYFLGFASSVVVTNGLPRMNASWWQMLMYHDALQTMMISMAAIPIKLWITLISPFLTALMMLASSLPQIPAVNGLVFSRVPGLRSALGAISSKTASLRTLRADLELYCGLFLVVMGLMGRVNFLSCFMYWNTLRMKYSINDESKAAFGKVHRQITGFLANPAVPNLFSNAYQKVARMMHKYGNSGNT